MTDKIVEAVVKAICGEPCDYPHCFCSKPAIYRTHQVARIVIAAYQASQWQDISTAPMDGTAILLINGNWQIVGHWHRHQNCWANNGPSYEQLPKDEQPTHWQPLPPAPSPTSSDQDLAS